MAIVSFEEMKMLRDVLIILASVAIKTKETLSEVSNGVFSATDTSQRIKSEINRLELSIETTNSLVLHYERHLREEAEKGAMLRHMEEAKIITDAFRSLLHSDQQFPLPPETPAAGDMYRSTTAGKAVVSVPSSSGFGIVDSSGIVAETKVRTHFLSRLLRTATMPHSPAHLPFATVSPTDSVPSIQNIDRTPAPSTKPGKRDGKGTRRQKGRKSIA